MKLQRFSEFWLSADLLEQRNLCVYPRLRCSSKTNQLNFYRNIRETQMKKSMFYSAFWYFELLFHLYTMCCKTNKYRDPRQVLAGIEKLLIAWPAPRKLIQTPLNLDFWILTNQKCLLIFCAKFWRENFGLEKPLNFCEWVGQYLAVSSCLLTIIWARKINKKTKSIYCVVFVLLQIEMQSEASRLTWLVRYSRCCK